MANPSIQCKYCGANNIASASSCLACGAPIERPPVPPVRVTTVPSVSRPSVPPTSKDTTPEQIRDALNGAPIDQSLKEGLTAVTAGLGTLGVGAFVARTFAEAGSIAISSFLIGYFTSVTFSPVGIGLLGGIIVGLIVGLVVKRPWAVFLSGPVGTIAGLTAAHFLQPSLMGWPLSPLLAAIGGALLAGIGGRRGSMTGVSKWYTRLRPFLGMAGGLLFSLIGFGIASIAK